MQTFLQRLQLENWSGVQCTLCHFPLCLVGGHWEILGWAKIVQFEMTAKQIDEVAWNTDTVKLRAVDQSIIQFWTLCVKVHSP